MAQSQSWENEFLGMMDNKLPPTPRHIKVALVEQFEPLEINVGGLIYERNRGQVLFNASLLEHEDDATITSKSWQHPVEAKIKTKTTLKAHDRVAVVAMEGSQQILVLCKVVS